MTTAAKTGSWKISTTYVVWDVLNNDTVGVYASKEQAIDTWLNEARDNSTETNTRTDQWGIIHIEGVDNHDLEELEYYRVIPTDTYI